MDIGADKENEGEEAWEKRPFDWTCKQCGNYCFGSRDHCLKCNAPCHKRKNDWTCAECGNYCFGSRDYCLKCKTPKNPNPTVKSTNAPPAVIPPAAGQKPKNDLDWTCECGNLCYGRFANGEPRRSCRKCGRPRPTAAPSPMREPESSPSASPNSIPVIVNSGPISEEDKRLLDAKPGSWKCNGCGNICWPVPDNRCKKCKQVKPGERRARSVSPPMHSNSDGVDVVQMKLPNLSVAKSGGLSRLNQPEQARPSRPMGDQGEPNRPVEPEDWECECGNFCYGKNRTHCKMCGKPKPPMDIPARNRKYPVKKSEPPQAARSEGPPPPMLTGTWNQPVMVAQNSSASAAPKRIAVPSSMPSPDLKRGRQPVPAPSGFSPDSKRARQEIPAPPGIPPPPLMDQPRPPKNDTRAALWGAIAGTGSNHSLSSSGSFDWDRQELPRSRDRSPRNRVPRSSRSRSHSRRRRERPRSRSRSRGRTRGRGRSRSYDRRRSHSQQQTTYLLESTIFR